MVLIFSKAHGHELIGNWGVGPLQTHREKNVHVIIVKAKIITGGEVREEVRCASCTSHTVVAKLKPLRNPFTKKNGRKKN
ncbi:hypothetical protein TNIN_32671 [Trichonephila inaurata madagascariensis]|uniref:Uncharacterized protein n=1 Tax=Trichonephila inaurata madagascariensis TaxID=2747483 RepID=A0A8X6MHY2_9ARAC|nr:hypothetical protein TNIN_32671 [Trichonephila inaurata madagascariensis]